jgi:hypothetical protein
MDVDAWRIYPPWTIGAVLADQIIEPPAAGRAGNFLPSEPGQPRWAASPGQVGVLVVGVVNRWLV